MSRRRQRLKELGSLGTTQVMNEYSRRASKVKTPKEKRNLDREFQMIAEQDKAEISKYASDNELFKNLQKKHNEITSYINRSLKANQTMGEAFSNLVKKRNKTTLGRFLSSLGMDGLADKLMQRDLEALPNLLESMMENMVRNKNRIKYMLKDLKKEQDDIFEQMYALTDEMGVAESELLKAGDLYKAKREKLSKLEGILTDKAKINRAIQQLKAAGHQGKLTELVAMKTARIDEVQQLKDARDTANLKFRELLNMHRAYEVTEKQFRAYVTSMKSLATGLEIKLKYTAPLARKQITLSRAGAAGLKAIEAYNTWQQAMNDVLVLNSIGAKMLGYKTLEMIATPTYNQDALNTAETEIDTYLNQYGSITDKFHDATVRLVKSLEEAEDTSTKEANGMLEDQMTSIYKEEADLSLSDGAADFLTSRYGDGDYESDPLETITTGIDLDEVDYQEKAPKKQSAIQPDYDAMQSLIDDMDFDGKK